MTGRAVLAASIPGRWAAPPAPATMTRMPAAGGLLRVAEQPIGRAMRRHDRELGRHAELVEDRHRRLERREVGAAAADDADDGDGLVLGHRSPSFVASSAQARRPSAPRRRGERLVDDPARAPSGGPSCGVRRRAACRTGGGGRPGRRGRLGDAVQPGVAPRTAAEEVDHRGRAVGGRVDPSPSPQIARMCCSNCEVAAPSIVQWPELWTRGASSLTTSDPSRSRNSSDRQRAAQVHRARPASSRSRRRSAATSGGIGAGATDSTRIPASWTVPGDREGRRPRHRRRARRRPTALPRSRARARRAGRRPGGRPRRAQASSSSAAVDDPELAAPVVAADRQLEPQGQPERVGRGPGLVHGPDLAPRRDGDAGVLDEPAFGQPVLGHEQRPMAGPRRARAWRAPRRPPPRCARARRSRRRSGRPAAAPPRRRRTSR